jgi:hypothetical protein
MISDEVFSRKDAKAQRRTHKLPGARQALRLCAFA